MKSITKVDIDGSLVSQLVAAQFPQWADLPINPVEVDGWDNFQGDAPPNSSLTLIKYQTFVAWVSLSATISLPERHKNATSKVHAWNS